MVGLAKIAPSSIKALNASFISSNVGFSQNRLLYSVILESLSSLLCSL